MENINELKPWINQYEAGVPDEISGEMYNSLVEMLKTAMDKYQDLVAFECMGGKITYGQLDTLSDQFAAYLQANGLKRGDRVALQMPNVLQYPIALIGVLKAGMVVVNTNPLYTAREMEHQFNDANVSAILIVENFAHNLQKIMHKVPSLKLVMVTGLGDMLGALKGPLVNFVVKRVKKMVPPFHLPNAIPFKKVMKEAQKLKFSPVEMGRDDIAFLQYTGGTTGVAKGAKLLHRNLLANAEQHIHWMRNLLEERTEVVVTALPLYHIFALTVNFMTFFQYGCKNVLITNPRDMKAFLGEWKKHEVTIFTAVNTLFNGMMSQPQFDELSFKRLKLSIGGGMAIQDHVAEKWKAKTGVVLREGYGLTECSPVVSCQPFHDNTRLGSIGIPFPSTNLRIVGENDEVLPFGEKGELCVKGPQVMGGYWNNDTETAKVFVDGYLRTGDIAYIAEDGFVYLVDRKKEMINVSGFNVFPNEIESVIASHPKVLEVGVCGVPDDKSTEAPKAFIVKKDESLTEDEIAAYCKENLTAYKRPRQFAFRKELPKSSVGKIMRRLLK
ncbi:AMP-binding protein [Persicobacter diffluens]|uniref:Long-chain-fatty-acid--CoA ligase n=1 Tax=Persicobacter diffluens TaxID=981 RepID=A0AAN5AIR6_9BACT|nr:long-chain-fatty-acid--CoA ligase [Persicobacter diffluens]